MRDSILKGTIYVYKKAHLHSKGDCVVVVV